MKRGCRLGAILCCLVGLAASCSSSHPPAAGHSPATAHSPSGTPYSLYTHCGIYEARVGSTYFVADKSLDDGNANPPAGWGNPYQAGTINLPSPSTAVFRDDLGHVVTFHARPGATSFLRVCS